jgi:hypothetical protein
MKELIMNCIEKLIDWLDNHFYKACVALIIISTVALYFIIGISK